MGTGADQVKCRLLDLRRDRTSAAIPGPGCPANGCTLVDAVVNGSIPLAVFNQSLARILYQEQRFGLLGCDQTPVSSLCTNPGGIGADRTGTAPLPTGSTSGTPVLGTKNGDAAIVEKMTPRRARPCSRTTASALPLSAAGLNDGDVLVTGANANHTVADPTNEASTGMIDRDAVNPLQQLKEFSGKPGAFTFAPANDPTGYPVPSSRALALELDRHRQPRPDRAGRGQRHARSTSRRCRPRASSLRAATRGRGYVYVPTRRHVHVRVPAERERRRTRTSPFTFDGTARTLANAANVYGATTPGTPDQRGLHRAAADQPHVQRRAR